MDSPESRVGASRVAVVTGGSGGVGAAVVRLLAERGHLVEFTYRSNAAAAEAVCADVAEAAGADAVGSRGTRGLGSARASALDLADDDAVASYARSVLDRHGRLDVLVHAAGPHIPMIHLSRVSPAEFAAHTQAEVGHFFTLMHAFLPALRANAGAVVAVTTAATRRYPVRDGLSAAPKAAVEGLVKAFAAEEGRFGVRVNAVGPGMLTDGMAARLMADGDLDERALAVARANIPLRRFGSAEDVAHAVAYLASPEAGFVTGVKLDVDGGYGV